MVSVNKLKRIAANFDISFKKAVAPDDAFLSSVYILDEKYILRSRSLDSKTLRDFIKENLLISHVKDLIPYRFPELIKTVENNHYCMDGNLLWTIYPRIKGDIAGTWRNISDVQPEITIEFFKTLRRIHEKTLGIYREQILASSKSRFFFDVAARLQQENQMLPGFVVKRISSALKQTQEYSKNLSTDSLCFVHGDFHPANVIVKRGKIIGLIDLDWCRIGSALEDLGYTVMMYLRKYDQKKFDFDQKSLDRLLETYGLDKRLFPIFTEYLLVCIFFDYSLFKNTAKLPNKKFYVDFQFDFLKDMCRRY